MVYPVLGMGVVTAAVLLCTGTCSCPKKKSAITDAAVSKTSFCIFCTKTDTNKRSVVDAQKIGETKDVRVLLDRAPMLPGHVLITTTQHKERAHELTDLEVLAEHGALQQIVAMYKTKYKAENYFVLQKNGKMAGQSVPHYHKHVYPIASKADLRRANVNFARAFFTFGLLAPKLKGEKLAKLQQELTQVVRLTGEIASPAPTDTASASSVAAAASCAICLAPTSTSSNAQPLAQIIVMKKQIGPGHVIIKTTRHVEKAHERTPEEVLACHKALQKVVKAYQVVFGTDEYMQIQENGAASGQYAPHFHTHLYAALKTKHEYIQQAGALMKYSFQGLRSMAKAEPGSLQDKFIQALSAE